MSTTPSSGTETMLIRESRAAQWQEPQPAPPASAASSPSSTWKEWPQPHAALTFGLLIAKPAWSPSSQSISVPAM